MSFNEKIIERRAREWGMTKEEVKKIGKRMARYIETEARKNKGEITAIVVLKSFFIFEEVKNKRYNKKAKELALNKLKNKKEIVEKYADKIIDLHILQSWGSRKIAKHLKEKYNVDISYSTIYKFLRAYKKEKKEQNG